MTKKLIGLPFWKTGENSIGSTLAYVIFAEQYGEVIPLMPNHAVRRDLDLLILPGGPDINPLMYNEIPGYYTSKPDLQKDYFDKVYLPKYIANGTPVFGVCRGMQSLGILWGGKLIQNMQHETNKPEDPYKCVHKVQLDTDTFWNWKDYTNGEKIETNSRHHQTVNERYLNDSFTVVGRHEGDHNVEMIAHRELPLFGFQGHPEDIYDGATNAFVTNIIDRLIITRKSILHGGL